MDQRQLAKLQAQRHEHTEQALRTDVDEARFEADRWQKYLDAVIAMAPVEIRRHVLARLDVTGTGYVENGLWNYILKKTA